MTPARLPRGRTRDKPYDEARDDWSHEYIQNEEVNHATLTGQYDA